MSGRKFAQKLQIGKETTPGTAVAATSILDSNGGMLQNDLVYNRYKPMTGISTGQFRTYISGKGGSLSMAQIEATYEQADWVFSAAHDDKTTGSADGAGSSGYTREYTTGASSQTAVNTPMTVTIEGGDNNEAEEMEYAFVTRYRLMGEGSQALMIEADWVGRQISNASFTGALTPTTVEPILYPKGTLYIDPSGSIGSTAVSNTLLSIEIEVVTGWQFKDALNGQLYPAFFYFNQDAYDITVRLTYEHNSTATTERTAWENETVRAIRYETTGSAYGTAGSGTVFSGVKGLRIDMAGVYTNFAALDSQDGNSIVTCEFKPQYNATDGFDYKILLANEVADTTA